MVFTSMNDLNTWGNSPMNSEGNLLDRHDRRNPQFCTVWTLNSNRLRSGHGCNSKPLGLIEWFLTEMSMEKNEWSVE